MTQPVFSKSQLEWIRHNLTVTVIDETIKKWVLATEPYPVLVFSPSLWGGGDFSKDFIKRYPRFLAEFNDAAKQCR